ncbi:MAG: hypothetical protein ACOC80_09325, partial [Petrotogales bacterium]
MIEIKTERIKMKHKRYYQVNKIKALDLYSLPKEYINTRPHCFLMKEPIFNPALIVKVTDEVFEQIRNMPYVTSFIVPGSR